MPKTNEPKNGVPFWKTLSVILPTIVGIVMLGIMGPTFITNMMHAASIPERIDKAEIRLIEETKKNDDQDKQILELKSSFHDLDNRITVTFSAISDRQKSSSDVLQELKSDSKEIRNRVEQQRDQYVGLNQKLVEVQTRMDTIIDHLPPIPK